MAERIRFHFDPLCPWCYQTSRWVRRLSELGEVDVDWAVFSLDLVNAGSTETRAKGHARAGNALRTVIAVRDAAGAAGVGAFYAAVGRRHHEQGEPLEEDATIRAALADAGLDTGLLDAALADDGTWAAVEDEHRQLVERTRSFGVPTIVLDGGDGPAIFGPVVSVVPSDDDAVSCGVMSPG
jgi:protein-disulfide isomerase-like protein with CxxC motif